MFNYFFSLFVYFQMQFFFSLRTFLFSPFKLWASKSSKIAEASSFFDLLSASSFPQRKNEGGRIKGGGERERLKNKFAMREGNGGKKKLSQKERKLKENKWNRRTRNARLQTKTERRRRIARERERERERERDTQRGERREVTHRVTIKVALKHWLTGGKIGRTREVDWKTGLIKCKEVKEGQGGDIK